MEKSNRFAAKNAPKQFLCSTVKVGNSNKEELHCVEIPEQQVQQSRVQQPRTQVQTTRPIHQSPTIINNARRVQTTVAVKTMVKSSNCSGAKFTTNFIKDNAIFQNELGNGSAPPDTIMAIGPSTAVAMSNQLIGYYQRPTMNRVNLEFTNVLFPFGSTGGGADVQVIYDEFSSRFFALAWALLGVNAQLTITSPSGVAGVYDARKMVNSSLASFPVSGEIVPTDPVDCYDTGLATWAVTPACQAALNGKIALIKRRAATLPLGPGNNARSVATLVRSYGAIGVILYDDQNEALVNFGGLNVSPSYPQLTISLADGLALAAAYGSYPPYSGVSPLNGTLSALTAPIQKNYMNIAVSKTSAPLSVNDWYTYQFTTNYWLNANVEADYPKITVDQERFYIATQDFDVASVEAVVTVLNKANLVNHTAPSLINESSSTFISQNGFMGDFIPQPVRIVYSCYKDYLPQFFMTLAGFGLEADDARLLNAATGLRVFVGSSMSQYIEVPFPVPTQIDGGALAAQPLTSTGASTPGLEAIHAFVHTAVIYKTSIFAAHTILNGANRSIIRWYELDVSRAVAYNTISIKQWGNIDTCQPGESCFQPCVNVDKCGNLAITFTISGPNRLPTFAYTGRLKHDPPGTVRTPYQTIKVSPYPYNGSISVRPHGTGPVTGNRWGDYASVVVDPNDHKTFFTLGEVSSDGLAPAVATDVNASKQALKWTTTMASFNISESCGSETSPGVPCPPEPPAPQLPDIGAGGGEEEDRQEF